MSPKPPRRRGMRPPKLLQALLGFGILTRRPASFTMSDFSVASLPPAGLLAHRPLHFATPHFSSECPSLWEIVSRE